MASTSNKSINPVSARPLRILLVEPDYRRHRQPKKGETENPCPPRRDDDVLWYPPLGLMKLAEFHIRRGDEVHFVSGCDKSVLPDINLFDTKALWDRVYITTLFTFHYDKIIKTINFYKEAVGGTFSKIYVGGVMASLMDKEIAAATTISPTTGIVTSAKTLGFSGRCNIDKLPPAYEILDPNIYAINETYYAYTTRGCVNKCKWCGVPQLEPQFSDYINIKPLVRELRKRYGDKPRLKLMDNNVLASSRLKKVVEDLLELGYGKGVFTKSSSPKQRTVDFNQGVDASFINKDSIQQLAKLNIKPLRIAFDRIHEKKLYTKAVELAIKYGFTSISNYMLFNFSDSPKDLYERLCINISLNQKWLTGNGHRVSGKIYSYPMRFAPIKPMVNGEEHHHRDYIVKVSTRKTNWINNPNWTKKFVRNVEIMKGAAHGAISPTPTLARRTLGANFEEFLLNLYMPEDLLRNRNKHERKVYTHEPKRRKGTGKVEEFRKFMLKMLRNQDDKFFFFHEAVTANTVAEIRKALAATNDKELRKWLKVYLVK